MADLPTPIARRDHDRVTVALFALFALFGLFFASFTDSEARALIEQLQVALVHPKQDKPV